jgi:cell division protein FtsW
VVSSRVPYLLVGTTVALTALGLVMVLSASNVYAKQDFGSSFWFFKRQAMYATVGIAAMVATSFLPYRAWRKLSIVALAVSALLLVVVLHPSVAEMRTASSSGGGTVGGATRWITFGPVTIQPSEIAKLALLLFGAMILERKYPRIDDLGHATLPFIPVVAVLCGLVMLQPDLGTTIVLASIAFVLCFVVGYRLRWLLVGSLLASAVGTYLIMSEGYRARRFLSYLNPWADAHNGGYQVVQGLLALGSGGWTGVGLGASRGKWMYVPNAHTDFIFAILGEELGLLGMLAVLFVFGLLLYAGIRVAVRTTDVFGRLLAAGIVGWIGLQTLVNLGAVTAMLPVTGVPLPFVSFGGSSLVVMLAAVGILVNIARTAPAEAVAAGSKGSRKPGARARPPAPRKRAASGGRAG